MLVIPTLTRNSTAYREDGLLAAANVPRFEAGWNGQALLIEESTTNLLNANQASAETSAAGFGGWLASISRDTSVSWHGAAAILCTFPETGNSGGAYTTPAVAVTAGLPYSFSAYARSASPVQLRPGLEWKNSSGATIATSYGPYTPLTSLWQRLKLSATAPAGAVTVVPTLYGPNDSRGSFHTDGWLLEQKGYCTSFTDGTRLAELLTIPRAGLVDAAQGTIEFRAKMPSGPPTYLLAIPGASGGNENRLFLYGGPASTGTVAMRVLMGDGATSALTPTLQVTRDQWHHFSARWTATTLKFSVDGVSVEAVRSGTPPNFGSQIYLGSSLGSSWANALIGDLRFYPVALTDSQVKARYEGEEL